MTMFLYISILGLLIVSNVPKDVVGGVISVGELSSCQDNGHVSEAGYSNKDSVNMMHAWS